MSAQPAIATLQHEDECLSLARVASFPRLRVLAWSDDILYASRGYELLKARLTSGNICWETVGHFQPTWWRSITSTLRLGSRLVRDGFHALAVLPSGGFTAAVPGAIITLAPGTKEFRVTHRIQRGTRPLHITVVPSGSIFWGEYFDNVERDEVHIYGSSDSGMTWDVAHTFPKHSIRHVHNIVYDHWENCLWILTGDRGDECGVLRASCDLKTVDVVLSGNQQARAVALVPTKNGVYFASDTPLETNCVYFLDRGGNLTKLTTISSSSIYGCQVQGVLFFSSMVEPSTINPDRHVRVYGSRGGQSWNRLMEWSKDRWPMRFFQYGNAILPDGHNSTDFLALTAIAVETEDLVTSIWRV